MPYVIGMQLLVEDFSSPQAALPFGNVRLFTIDK
jgi:hypothetical protein